MSLDLKREPRKEVMSISIIDNGFVDEKVERDTPATLFCKKHDGYTPIIFKSETGPGFKGKKTTRWLSVEALPLVHNIDLNGNPVIVQLKDYLRTIWGDKGYNGLPQPMKEKLDQEIGVTVSVAPIIPDEDTQLVLNKVKAKSILYDQDLENTANLGKTVPPRRWHEDLMLHLPWVGFGMGLALVLQSLGVLK